MTEKEQEVLRRLGINSSPWYYGKQGHVVTEFGQTICQTHSRQAYPYENSISHGPCLAASSKMLLALIEWAVYAEKFTFIESSENNPFGVIESATGRPWSEVRQIWQEAMKQERDLNP